MKVKDKGILAFPAKIDGNKIETVAAWFPQGLRFRHAMRILEFGGKVRGTISVASRPDLTIVITWSVPLETPEQVENAATTLAGMLSAVMGIRLLRRKLQDSAAVNQMFAVV